MSSTKPEKGLIGRPKGSKNEVTIMKVAMEFGVRSRNIEKIEAILNSILDDALSGDKDCRKLVWQSVMSKAGSNEQQTSGEMPQIVIRTEGSAPKIKQVEVIDVAHKVISNG